MYLKKEKDYNYKEKEKKEGDIPLTSLYINKHNRYTYVEFIDKASHACF